MYWIRPRDLWGDYGAMLFHGEAFFSKGTSHVPPGSVVLRLCCPHSSILLPPGLFLCDHDVLELIMTSGFSLNSEPVWVERLVEIPIDRWLKRGTPTYPRGGEPESFFDQYDQSTDFIPGFDNNIFRVIHDSTVKVFVPSITTTETNPTPQVMGHFEEKCHLVLGKMSERSRYGPLFCSEQLAEVLQTYGSENFELVPLKF